jgi:hypothetical protein
MVASLWSYPGRIDAPDPHNNRRSGMANHTGRGNHGNHGFGDDDDGRGFDGDHGRHADKPVTFDQFDTTTYLHSDDAADGSFAEHFILQVNGFEQNGSPVTLPGFGSHYGMYFPY